MLNLIPFSYSWIIRHLLSNNQTILDIGTGDGSLMATINFDNKYIVDGYEIYNPYINKAKLTKKYRDVRKIDIRKLKIRNKSYDCVLCSQVIEHLTQPEAMTLLNKCNKIARNIIIIGTPNGWIKQEIWEGNTYQKHKSAWSPLSFENLGYRVCGTGLNIVYGDEGLLKRINDSLIRITLYGISFLANPLTYVYPKIAAQLIAFKYI